MTNTVSEPCVEKPLSGASKLALACGAGAMILLFYLFVVVSILSLLALLGCELLILLAAARFGLAGPMVRAMNGHLAPLPVFFRSLWVRKGTEFQLSLQPEDAPGLFAVVKRLCERVKVALPRAVWLEMNVNAWVRLKGYRRGAGRTILGIGYDLIAGLSEAEIEAVLAHEMMHAKLVQRGLKSWLIGGLNRAAQLARGLSAQAEAARRARQSAGVTEGFLRTADWLARTCARLVAACSRQDEFAADRGAAELCGAGAVRSALERLELVNRNTARLPWRERVAQLQSGEGFSRWLVKELTASDGTESLETKDELFNKYSTHPSLKDRLAALPPTAVSAPGESPSAIGLLAEPDKTAEKLIAEIQRVVAQEEQKDSKALDRWSRKVRAGSRLRPIQSLGVLVAALGLIAGLITGFTTGMSSGVAEFIAATVVPGILCYRFGGYRERAALPVPDFASLKAAWQGKAGYEEAKAKELESELRACVPAETRARERARLMAAKSYHALYRCDYLKAHVAARLCLEKDKESVEGAIGFAIAAAALGQGQQVTWALQCLQQRTRMVGVSATWGAAWTLFLCGDWVHAEAFLQQTRKGRPEEPTLLALLAFCQSRRGKLQSAILSARQACTPEPRNKEYAKLLVDLLLDGGFLREAQERLGKLEGELRKDTELMFAMVRLHLLLRNNEEAKEWAGMLERDSTGAHMLVRLGGAHEMARKSAEAGAYYYQALAAGYYPEALLGLGRLAAQRQDKEQARRHLLAALDINRTPGEGSVGPLQILQQTIGHLVQLQEPILNCQAWIATFNGGTGPKALAHQSFLIYAPDQPQAEQCLNTILAAMQPDAPPIRSATIGWRQASREQQPDGPVRPGVQGVFA